MTAMSLPTTGMAPPVVSDCVDSTKTRRGERDEQLGVIGHRVGNTVMAAVEGGVDQLPDVAGVQIRAGRARQRAAVVTPRKYVMLSAELIGALQTNWARAESGPLCGIPPGVETLRRSPSHHLCQNRTSVDTNRRTWQRGDLGSEPIHRADFRGRGLKCSAR